MKTRTFVTAAACCSLLLACGVSHAQTTAGKMEQGMQKMDNMGASGQHTLPSPRKEASVSLNGKAIHISYGAPSIRKRKIMGGLVPYGQWWRTGANEATTFETAGNVKVGTLNVPAGKYTLVTIPSAGEWKLVVCKHTGQWGTERFEKDDLGSTVMMKGTLPSPQEVMSISFDKTSGAKTELHIRWETTDVAVPVSAM